MTSTQQNEARQAVRLLFVAAFGGGSSDHKNPEMLYRARVLLEEFIESAGVLESTEDSSNENDIIYEGVLFRLGGSVYALDPSERQIVVTIERFVKKHSLAGVGDSTQRFSLKFQDMLALNPLGSF